MNPMLPFGIIGVAGLVAIVCVGIFVAVCWIWANNQVKKRNK